MFSAPGVYTLNFDVLQGSATQRQGWDNHKQLQQLEFCLFLFSGEHLRYNFVVRLYCHVYEVLKTILVS